MFCNWLQAEWLRKKTFDETTILLAGVVKFHSFNYDELIGIDIREKRKDIFPGGGGGGGTCYVDLTGRVPLPRVTFWAQIP